MTLAFPIARERGGFGKPPTDPVSPEAQETAAAQVAYDKFLEEGNTDPIVFEDRPSFDWKVYPLDEAKHSVLDKAQGFGIHPSDDEQLLALAPQVYAGEGDRRSSQTKKDDLKMRREVGREKWDGEFDDAAHYVLRQEGEDAFMELKVKSEEGGDKWKVLTPIGLVEIEVRNVEIGFGLQLALESALEVVLTGGGYDSVDRFPEESSRLPLLRSRWPGFKISVSLTRAGISKTSNFQTPIIDELWT